MIQKTNNISFKSVFLFPSINNLAKQNRPKVDKGIKVTQDLFPQNDVFLGADEKGELTIQVQKANPLKYLLEPDVAEHINLRPQEILALINVVTMLQASYDKLWDKKQPLSTDKTIHIDKMQDIEVIKKITDTVIDFNEKYQEPLN